jgi:hypothetical protein
MYQIAINIAEQISEASRRRKKQVTLQNGINTAVTPKITSP